MATDKKQIATRVNEDTYFAINQIATVNGISLGATLEKLVEKGLAVEQTEGSRNEIELILRRAVEDALAPTSKYLGTMISKAMKSSFIAEMISVEILNRLVDDPKELSDIWKDAQEKAAFRLLGKDEKQ